MDTLFQRLKNKFKQEADIDLPPVVTGSTSLEKVLSQFSKAEAWLREKYSLELTDEDRSSSLDQFTKRHKLPPSQILFMEFQLHENAPAVQPLTAEGAAEFIDTHSTCRVIDVREDWERKICSIPGSRTLDTVFLDELLHTTQKDTPLLLYCHFGIRSLDAAVFLASHGFSNVHIIQGGIDAWSQVVDASLPRYEQAYC